jgi:uncharacterized membrane protein
MTLPYKLLMNPIPNDWAALHPLTVHFPIALLFVAPLFLLLGAVFSKHTRLFLVPALILMWLGTAGIYMAVATGEASSEQIQAGEPVLDTLKNHDELGRSSRLIYTILTLVFTAFCLWTNSRKNRNTTVDFLFLLVFLAGYAYASVVLYNAAHQGGRLVHLHGIKSTFYNTPAPAVAK